MIFFNLFFLLTTWIHIFSVCVVFLKFKTLNETSLINFTLQTACFPGKTDHQLEPQFFRFGFQGITKSNRQNASGPIKFNEIMADPNPIINLPDAEFVEIINISPQTLDISGYKLADNSRSVTLPSAILKSNEIAILCREDDAPQFMHGKVIGLSSWPSLNNDEDLLTLSDPEGQISDQINYEKSWYRDEIKSNGGWSMELIDPMKPCSDKSNWTASIHADGGTPGNINSVFEITTDHLPPMLKFVYPLNSHTIEIGFNEPLNQDFHMTIMMEIKPELTIDSVYSDLVNPKNITVRFKNEMHIDSIYQIIVGNIRDCSGNIINESDNLIAFGLPRTPAAHNIVVSEILFNPFSGSKDFVELFNHSSYFIDLNSCFIAGENNDKNKLPSGDISLIMAPGAYLVLTEDPRRLLADYPKAIQENLITLSDIPSLPDNQGVFSIYNPENVLVDSLYYSEAMHHPLISDPEGVSLERIDVSTETNQLNNWHSASSQSGYATPGYKNSQSLMKQITGDEINIHPKVFNPDNNGQDDYLSINCLSQIPGSLISIWIFDLEGRRIRQIVNNRLAGVENLYIWDGADDQGKVAPPGYYIVGIEIFNIDEGSRKYKLPVVLARNF